MPQVQRILVKSSAGSYEVVCGARVLSRFAIELTRLGKFSSVHCGNFRKVWTAIGKQVLRGLRGLNPRVHKFNDREDAKNLQSVEAMARVSSERGADRGAVLIAVGGGVVGDVAGFCGSEPTCAESRWCRCRTTMVAQTDSADRRQDRRESAGREETW
jgi:3-dehydroquinate synthetase